MKQKFSVLLSVFEKDNYNHLSKCLESIWDKQSIKPNEIIIIKDGILDEYKDNLLTKFENKAKEKIRVISLEKNLGLGNALNVGLNKCNYDIVARMDADDIAMSNRFELQLKFMTTHNVDILGSFAKEIDMKGNVTGYRKVPVNHKEIYLSLWANSIIHSTVMFKRKKILKAGSYNPIHRRRQDYDLWFRCAKNGYIFHNIPEFLVNYRFSDKTLKKQSSIDYFKQGIIGFNGSSMIGLSYLYRFLCFYPFLRSILPISLQIYLYHKLKKFDPRNQ